MNVQDIPSLRLATQKISNDQFDKPEQVVSFLGAVQSQDFLGATWAIGLRLKNGKSEDIEKAFDEGKILRTHALRPTWHFVMPEDLKWLVELNAPQVKKIMSYYNKKLEINEELIKKSNAIIEKALKGNNFLTREELAKELESNNIKARGQRLGHIVAEAELDAIICSGPKKGKQFTYALVEDRTPKGKSVSRDEALAKLAKIFYESRGPASIKDFAKWSGLPMADARQGLAEVSSKLLHETIEGQEYWWKDHKLPVVGHSSEVYLLPNYDEYISSYADYSLISTPETTKNLKKIGNALFWNHMISNGMVVGSWRRTLDKKILKIELSPLKKLTVNEKIRFEKKADDLGNFFEIKPEIIWI